MPLRQFPREFDPLSLRDGRFSIGQDIKRIYKLDRGTVYWFFKYLQLFMISEFGLWCIDRWRFFLLWSVKS